MIHFKIHYIVCWCKNQEIFKCASITQLAFADCKQHVFDVYYYSNFYLLVQLSSDYFTG